MAGNPSRTMSMIIDLAEQGFLPDRAIRIGISLLNRQRLRDEHRSSFSSLLGSTANTAAVTIHRVRWAWTMQRIGCLRSPASELSSSTVWTSWSGPMGRRMPPFGSSDGGFFSWPAPSSGGSGMGRNGGWRTTFSRNADGSY